ncbi:MAG: peroxiredoxin-like family protein [Burkholderiales bacterium]|jgi:peroxiredoxin
MNDTTPLAALLDAYRRHASERAPAVAAALDDEARAIVRSGRLAGALKAGDALPDLPLPDSPDGRVRLPDLVRDGPLVLLFYLGRWCPFCTLELRAWQRALPRIRALGGRLAAVSPQDEREVALTRERDRLEFHLVADPGNALARRFGIAHEVAPALRDAYLASGMTDACDGDASDWTLPMPAVYLVGRDGRIDWAHVDPDWRRRAEPAEVVARLAALAGR